MNVPFVSSSTNIMEPWSTLSSTNDQQLMFELEDVENDRHKEVWQQICQWWKEIAPTFDVTTLSRSDIAYNDVMAEYERIVPILQDAVANILFTLPEDIAVKYDETFYQWLEELAERMVVYTASSCSMDPNGVLK